MSDWKNVQYKDGKMRTSEGGGGGGSSTLAGLNDVNLSSLADNQPLRYNATSQKWVNGADSFPPIIYSDTEREVGVWRDGKPLYQKTVDCGALPNNTTKNVNHNISNIDFIVKAEGYALAPNVNSIPIPFVNNDNATSQVVLMTTTSVISLRTSVDRSAYTKSYVTLYYTKTTDTAGSGIWTTEGGYAHHYSTSEKVIGTWVDGKPIYEKTIVKNNIAVTPPDGYIAHEIQNVNMVIRLNVLTFNSNSPTSYTSESGGLSFTGGSSTTIMNGFRADRTNIMFIGTAGSGAWSADVNRYWYFTLQYTKTTD